MQYVEAPKLWVNNVGTSLFLAGGITNCPDWQSEVTNALKNTDLVILNPRRTNFPMDDPKAAGEQIRWEFAHMRLAGSVLFWFPEETLCPITLFELGSRLEAFRYTPHYKFPQSLFIGTHPNYLRRQDVQIQSNLAGHKDPIYKTIDDLVDAVRERYANGK